MYHIEVDLTANELIALGFAMGYALTDEELDGTDTRAAIYTLANKVHRATFHTAEEEA